jgi:general secretion pathway protein L
VAFEATNLRLFGLDLSDLAQILRRGWDGLRRWPLCAWLNPAEPVWAHWPDGTRRAVLGASNRPAPNPGAIDFHALVLPPDLVLTRSLRLPHLADAEIEAALQLELQAESPFPVEALDWGWRLDRVDDSGLAVTLAFAARDHVEAEVRARRGTLPDHFEIWADAGGPVVLRGRGEQPRLRRVQARRRRILLLVLLNGVLLGILSAAPYWQLRARTIDAQRQLELLQNASRVPLEARAALVEADTRAAAIAEWRRGQADMPALLHKLTLLLPDNAYLNRFDAEGRRVRITGSAADGAGLMDSLRADPGIGELRALSPIVRGRDGLDNFYLEFQILPPPAAPAAVEAGGEGAG